MSFVHHIMPQHSRLHLLLWRKSLTLVGRMKKYYDGMLTLLDSVRESVENFRCGKF